MRNTNLMVPCPAFEEAAEMIRERPGLCVGLHTTLNSEWDHPDWKWGPVLPPEEVPSLVNERGHFFQSTQQLAGNDPDPDEVIAELQAQLDRAREHGVEVTFASTHMGWSWIGDLAERFAEWAEAEGLLHGYSGVERLPGVEGEFEDPVEQMLARLRAAGPGTYAIGGHPGYDNEEMAQFGHEGYRRVGAERDRDRRLMTDPRVVEYCAAEGISAIRRDEV
jgi:hypothetical protein